MRQVSRILDVVSAAVVAVAGFFLVALIAMMGWVVFGRYVMNDTPTWVERGASLVIVAIALPVAAVGVRERFHLSVLGMRESLPLQVQRWIALFCDATVGLFGLAMVVYGQELAAMVAPFKVPLLGISQAWTYWPMVVSGALIMVFAAEQVILGLINREGPVQRGVTAAFLE
ncbi:MAG: TRAP transporter small permease [Pseudomonadota bacterium]